MYTVTLSIKPESLYKVLLACWCGMTYDPKLKYCGFSRIRGHLAVEVLNLCEHINWSNHNIKGAKWKFCCKIEEESEWYNAWWKCQETWCQKKKKLTKDIIQFRYKFEAFSNHHCQHQCIISNRLCFHLSTSVVSSNSLTVSIPRILLRYSSCSKPPWSSSHCKESLHLVS